MEHIQILWTQTKTGSMITWKYPSAVSERDDTGGDFYSFAYTCYKKRRRDEMKILYIIIRMI